MNKRFFIFLLAVLLSSCKQPSTSSTIIQQTDEHPPTVTPSCGVSPKPAKKDVDRALAHTGEIFSAPEWEQSYAVAETTVAVTWQNVVHGALAYLEMRIKPCGYEESDLDKDFSNENWKAIFANYESYKSITECRTNKGLRLYQFNTKNQGVEYAINFWAQSDTDTRVIVTMIVFPVEEKTLLADYSKRLFPNLPDCP